MTDLAQADAPAKPAPLVISRSFPAPRALVFRAWSTAEHIKRWFSPAAFTTPHAEVDFRPGGVFAVCMRWPNGTDVWSRGRFLEIDEPRKLVFQTSVGDEGAPGFTAHTTVVFEDEGAGTRITVTQAYDIHDPAFAGAISGAPEGWRTTLDKLGAEIERLKADGERVVHDAARP